MTWTVVLPPREVINRKVICTYTFQQKTMREPRHLISCPSLYIYISLMYHTFASSNLPRAFSRFPRSLRTQYKSWKTILNTFYIWCIKSNDYNNLQAESRISLRIQLIVISMIIFFKINFNNWKMFWQCPSDHSLGCTAELWRRPEPPAPCRPLPPALLLN